jgi:ribosome-binding protein aMBF1 (putative translation factor)
MTQQGLAELIERDRSHISHLESGRVTGSVQTWDRLETVLGVDQKILRQIDKEKP